MTISKEQLTIAVRADVREELKWAEAQEWQYRDEPDTYTPEELAKVTALQAQWTALSERGEKEGWLEWSGGYRDGEWEVADNRRHPTRTVPVRETKANRTRRLIALEHEIEQKVKQRVESEWKALQKAEEIADRVRRR
jgi:hypothetical protein